MKDFQVEDLRLFTAKQILLASIRAFAEELAQLDSDEAAEAVDELNARLRANLG